MAIVKTHSIVLMLLLTLLVQMMPTAMSATCGMASTVTAPAQADGADRLNGLGPADTMDHAHYHDSISAAADSAPSHASCCSAEDASVHCMMSSCLPISIPSTLNIGAADILSHRFAIEEPALPLVPIHPLFRPPIV